MKRLNNKGFSTVEALLILIIIALIVGVGYWVYSQNKTTESKNTNTQASQETTEKTDDKTTEYKNETIGFSFEYPNDWTKTQEADSAFKDYVTFKSPDHEETPDNPHGRLKSGGLIYFQLTATEYKTVKEANKDNPFFSKEENSTIAGMAAWREDKCGLYGQDSICVEFIKDGLYYSFSYKHPYEESSETAKYKKQFDDLLASIKFN